MPVATLASPTTTRPQMTSPSSQPMRSMSKNARCTSVALPPQTQVRSWTSLAWQTTFILAPDASIDTPQDYPEDLALSARHPRARSLAARPGVGALVGRVLRAGRGDDRGRRRRDRGPA